MNRREFIHRGIAGAVGAGVLSGYGGMRSSGAEPGDALPRPSPAQLRWQEAEVGVIFHFDLPVAAHRFESNNAVRETLDPRLYRPAQLDTDQWVDVAKRAGARYAIFTATHFNGFMQWQSDLYPYGMKQAAWRGSRGDVVSDFVISCRNAGLLPGIYLSTHRNAYWHVWGHYVDWGRGRGTPAQQRFNRIAEAMVEELCSRYGPLVQIWFDAGVKTPAEGGPDVLPIFERYQPDSVFYHNRRRSDIRWVGNEDGHTGDPCWATMPNDTGEVSHNCARWQPMLDTGDPQGSYWSPAMVDVPLRSRHGIHNWFWHPNQDHAVYTADDLMQIYNRSVGRNANLVIGAVIDPEGKVPPGDAQAMEEFGRQVRRRSAHPITAVKGTGRQWEISLPFRTPVNQILAMEDIRHGERIRKFILEAQHPDGTWHAVTEGQCVGHKKILTFPALESDRLRLRVTAAAAEPILRRLAVYPAEVPSSPATGPAERRA